MQGFRKGPEPAELRAERVQWAAAGQPLEGRTTFYLSAPTMLAVQSALARDQAYLCAYCGSRIRPPSGDRKTDMRIEHWDPQHAAPEKRYAWENLLGACEPKGTDEHCDVRRGKLPPARQTLSVKPDRDHARLSMLFRFESGAFEGTRIASDDPAAHADVDVTLNLNALTLRVNRAAAVESVRERIRRLHPGRVVKHATLDRLIAVNERGEAEPYLAAVLQLVERYRRKAG
jgi:uncharacterized protein (TIGR02646 family)